MRTLGKYCFILAPVCLFISFFAGSILQNNLLASLGIVLATIFLVLALLYKMLEARSNPGDKKEDKP